MANFRLFDPVGDASLGSTGIQGTTGISGGGSGGFFTDGAGTNAGIGKGATAPTASGDNALAQGDNSFAGGANSFAIGDTVNVNYQNSIGVGQDINNYSYNTAIFGTSNTSNAPYGNSLIVGDQNSLGFQGYHSFMLGYNNYSAGRQTFAQGRDNSIGTSSFFSFAQGGYNTLGTGNTNSFVQGSYNTGGFLSPRVFMQGTFCNAIRPDQKVWGSDRSVLGGAQASNVVKYLQVSGGVFSPILNLNLEEDKSYQISVESIGRDTTTNGSSVSSVLSQCLAYRDSGGAAVLVGPSAFTESSVGTVPNPAIQILSSGNNINIEVRNEPGQTFQFCVWVRFVEILG